MNTTWSTFVQSTAFLKASRIQIMNRNMAGAVCAKLGIEPGMKVLDVGTGTGEFIKYLAAVTTDVSYTGLDLDTVLIQAAKDDPFFSGAEADSTNSYRFVEGNAADLPFEDDAFDVVVSHTFLTACWYYEQALEEMRRVCKQEGLVGTLNISDFSCVSLAPGKIQPDMGDWYFEYRSVQMRFRNAWEAAFPIAQFNLGIDPMQIPGVLSQKGFEDVSVTPIGSSFSLSDASMPLEEKTAYIEHVQLAEEGRVKVLLEALADDNMFTQEDGDAYLRLLRRMGEYCLDHIDENSRWDHQAYTYLLVTAKPGRCLQMADSEYARTKFKAADPLSTVAKIKGILKSLNIETTERFVASGVAGVYSCRIEIKGTNIGQNGKGTTPYYALASGYAEFMERLATGFLFQADLPSEYRQKDAAFIPVDEVEGKCGSLLALSKRKIVGFLSAFSSVSDFMGRWDFASQNGCFEAFPFKRVSDGKTEYLPECIYRNYYYTNGSCAGNTKEEALTQGLSEIMERYAFVKILREDLTPPEVPEAELRAIPGVWDIICQIRSRANLKLRVFDASLGIGLPVFGALLIDTDLKTGRLKLGAHPRMESALERVLTEMLQGVSISTASRMSSRVSLENENIVHTNCNLFNMAKCSSGAFSYKIMLGTPSWEYAGFKLAPEDQRGQYEYLLDLCRSLSWDVYIRDCSFYGFPVYHVVVPGVSMIFDFGKAPLALAKKRSACKETLLNLADASKEDRLNALESMKPMRDWTHQDSLDWNTGVPLGSKLFGVALSYDLVKLLIDISDKAYDDALKTLRRYSGNDCFSILAEFCAGAQSGEPVEQVKEFLSVLYDAHKIQAVERVFADPLSCLPRVHCYQCHDCSLKSTCALPKLKPVLEALYLD